MSSNGPSGEDSGAAGDAPRHTVLLRTLIFVFREGRLLMMKYGDSGAGRSAEKAGRTGVYNPIGGHVERGEDVLESARREALEEAGIRLISPRIRGLVHIDGFAGKQMLNFLVVATTADEPVASSAEGELSWVDTSDVASLNVFDDVGPILAALLRLKSGELITGTATFRGFELLALDLHAA